MSDQNTNFKSDKPVVPLLSPSENREQFVQVYLARRRRARIVGTVTAMALLGLYAGYAWMCKGA